MFLLLALSAVASAIKITSPILNQTVAAGSYLPITWNSVDTDPTTLSLYLVNFVDYPPSTVLLAFSIPTAWHSYTVGIPSDTIPSWGYQINAVEANNPNVIYAQSPRFKVLASGDEGDEGEKSL